MTVRCLSTFSIAGGLLSLLLSGCGGPPQADYSSLGLVDVTGTVMLDGQPVHDAVITFQDLDTGGEAYGLTDDNGYYRMNFDSVEYGVMPGPKRVAISTTQKVLGLNTESEGGESADEGAKESETETAIELIPEAYRVDSMLKVTVSSSTSEFDFDLAADGSTTGAQ
ncbi:MAG: carboxypeptidase regulatory-like domain-containing protein [Fuerstiella sp.]|nr:carboxypeptidase regulatory-like domain-containing protein [Fuerstiella sp.]